MGGPRGCCSRRAPTRLWHLSSPPATIPPHPPPLLRSPSTPHARPDCVKASGAGRGALPHADRGVVCVWLGHAPRRGHSRGGRAQRGTRDPMSFLKTVESYRQGARTLPGRYYNDSEVFAGEQERIFGRHWICVGRDATLAAPGDYFVAQVGGESIILLRDQSGERRAYYNVCRHRGTRLCEAPKGRLSETIHCPYHAWTYALDGRLIRSPHMHDVQGFDKKSYPLHTVALAEWNGFLFVNLDPATVPAAQLFAPLNDRFAGYSPPLLPTVPPTQY